MKTINCEPNWVNLYKYFLHVKKTDPKTFARCKRKMGKEEWDKLEALAKRLMEEEK